MAINIGQIQNLLSSYQRQQVQSRLSEARLRGEEGSKGRAEEDRLIISAEAKRLQIYQKTAEEVLRRLKEETASIGGERKSLDEEAPVAVPEDHMP